MKYVLLKYHRDDVPLYFVIEWQHEEIYSTPEHVSYALEEHSCPKNWIGKTVAVIDGSDADPHGVLQFVKIVDAPKDEWGKDKDINDELQILFPEAFAFSTPDRSL